MAYSQITIGDKSPEIIRAVIEIPKGKHNKYEYDEKLDEIVLDRIIHSTVVYPTDYGFIPQARSEDGDLLDVMVIVSEPLFPGCVLNVRPIGVLDMADEHGQDWKIISVAENDPKNKNTKTIDDLDEHYKEEIMNFFEVYKQLEDKQVNVKGWLGQEKAFELIKEAIKRFQ